LRTLTYVMVEGLPLRGWVGRLIARSAVLLNDILADAPARRDLDPLADSPRTNGSGIDLRKGRLRRRNAAPTARDLPCCLDVPGEGLSKLRGVLVGQVQLVLMRIQSEANGGVGRVTGEVVDEQSRGPCNHTVKRPYTVRDSQVGRVVFKTQAGHRCPIAPDKRTFGGTFALTRSLCE
jgi:hypothetical protein